MNDEGVDGQGVDEGLVCVTLERGCSFLQNKTEVLAIGV
jgi:hypothetical protein